MKMSSKITQVEGCTFTTEELQRFHKFYKYDWSPVGLENSKLNDQLGYFSTNVDTTIDVDRLREWLRTMNIIDDDEKSEQQKLYDRFEKYDFSTAPGFNKMLGDVYNVTEISKFNLDSRMTEAKARYYSENIENLDHAEYIKFKEDNKPKPVCPYQHLWENNDSNGPASSFDSFANVKVVDLAEFMTPKTDNVLTAAILNRLVDDVCEGYNDSYYALAIIRSQSEENANDGTSNTGISYQTPHRVFLPPLDSTGDKIGALKAYTRLQTHLRKLNSTKPVVIFADGYVDSSALGIVFSTLDLVTTENFYTSLGTLSSNSEFPIPALFTWANIANNGKAQSGDAEYIACHPDLVLRSSELSDIGLVNGFLSSRTAEQAIKKTLMAATCPPPHTRDALRKSYVVESSYPGPSKIAVWRKEIAEYFAPLSTESKNLDDLISDLGAVGKPWTEKYLQFASTPISRRLADLRINALNKVRSEGLSKSLEVEFNTSAVWPSNKLSMDELLDVRTSLSDIVADTKTSSSDETSPDVDPINVEIPGECPFARMYRKNPDRFKHVDLKAISSHRKLNV